MINVMPTVNGVAQIFVQHIIKFKIFSKVPKDNYFYISIYKTNPNKILYAKATENFQEIDDILYYFIEKQQIPNTDGWIKTNFGD